MRKWIILGVILAVIVGAFALALANLNSYLNRNKDWLAGQVENALGRKVTFSEIGVQLFGGFGARIKDLSIADDPAFSKDDFLKAGDVQVSIRLLPALFGHYEVKRVELVRPEVTIIRTKDGFNYDSIGKRPPAGEPAPKPPPAAKAPSQEEGRGEKAAFLVSLVDIEKGQFRYLDRTTSPPGDIRARQPRFFGVRRQPRSADPLEARNRAVRREQTERRGRRLARPDRLAAEREEGRARPVDPGGPTDRGQPEKGRGPRQGVAARSLVSGSGLTRR